MKTIFLIFSIIFLSGCAIPGVSSRRPTSDNLRIAVEATKIYTDAETVRRDADAIRVLAKDGSEITQEEVSRLAFNTIGDHAENISAVSSSLLSSSEFIVRRQRGEVKLNFTFKMILWIVLGLLCCFILSYLGIAGLVRALVRAGTAPLVRVLNDVADAQAKTAFYSPVKNEEFPKGIRERMLKHFVDNEEDKHPNDEMSSV